ncbi:membrane protein YqaA, SNARE-associated domain [Saccharicrinis carchari]|uniref:Membrane protein YqaA, SNARE-associated domain n=1 Tax=Saccharicrinis carchari TaxID=1168039 RepID=A0A521EPA9_SACCC|nr:VTT domain-containing protein [Saccharicrinis carchari]SMO85732.1 membrane protein YqaA, SNARE-associated domain [Saccharicrinis carchari]
MQQNKQPVTIAVSMRRMVLLNRYYKITKFYSFLKNTAIRGGIGIIAFVLVLLGLEYFLLDFNVLLNNFVDTYSPRIVYSFFFLSETILGLIPPEVFIAWASKSSAPWLFLFLLASMSYLGGVASYFIGNRLFMLPFLRNYIQNKVANHIENLKKWGGFFVVLGAVSPIPHSMVSMASGLVRYNFKQYLLWSLFRYVRFLIYGLVIFQIF